MTTMQDTNFVSNWKEIVSSFLKLGATAYGGHAIMGLIACAFSIGGAAPGRYHPTQ
jgi:hypothetical protein